MKRTMLLCSLLLVAATNIHAAIQGKEVTYRAGETAMQGFLAYDDAAKEKHPGILVVHEWWGLNEHARQRARMLAELGYTALALDMYGEGKTAAHPDDAKAFSGELRKNFPLARERFLAALEVLKGQSTVDPERIAAIGFCFGGGVVLEMARGGLDLDGVASFHGTLGTENPARPGAFKPRVLVLNGAADTFIPPEQIAAFNKEMATAGVGYHFVNYEGAKHSFTNPAADENGRKFNLPLAYSPEADRRSWAELQRFLKEIFP